VNGLISGLGAATADLFYGCVAGFGLTAISEYIVNQQTWVRGVGGLFLGYLGLKTIFSRPSETTDSIKKGGTVGAYVSTILLTLSNPMTILSFAAVFIGLGLIDQRQDYISTTSLVLGVFIGSALWWLVLSTVVSLFRKRLSVTGLTWVNRISGIVIAAFGFLAIMSLVKIIF
jgi:threonine/homoserine/homoserine lactone efflux protein